MSHMVQQATLQWWVHVRFGSIADIGAGLHDVRFTPNSGHRNSTVRCLLCAKSGHSGCLWILLLMGKGAQVRWSITRERSAPTFPVSGSGRYAAPDHLAHCNGANLSVAASAVDRWIRARRRI